MLWRIQNCNLVSKQLNAILEAPLKYGRLLKTMMPLKKACPRITSPLFRGCKTVETVAWCTVKS